MSKFCILFLSICFLSGCANVDVDNTETFDKPVVDLNLYSLYGVVYNQNTIDFRYLNDILYSDVDSIINSKREYYNGSYSYNIDESAEIGYIKNDTTIDIIIYCLTDICDESVVSVIYDHTNTITYEYKFNSECINIISDFNIYS